MVRWFAMVGLIMAAPACASEPEEAAPAAEQGTEIETPGPEGPLRGTMIDAGADAPVVLLIPGSGPTDRDGNSPMGIRAASYRLLAEGLAAEGITTVRVDKRGMFGSAAAIANPNDVTIADYVVDVQSWTDVIRELTGAECVWLLGHSEGGIVALSAAQENTGICGLILAAAPGRPLDVILEEQLRANPANAHIFEEASGALAELKAGNRVDVSEMNPAIQRFLNPDVQDFLIDIMRIDPAVLAANIEMPVLILQGDRDQQVTMSDAEALHAAQPNAQLVRLPDTNHLFKRVTSNDRSEDMRTFSDPDLPLVPGIVEAIAEFVDGAE